MTSVDDYININCDVNRGEVQAIITVIMFIMTIM